MNPSIEIETEKLALLKALESLFGSITLESIAELVEGVDFVLLQHLGESLVRQASYLFNSDRISEETQSFQIGNIRIEVEIACNIQQEGCLLVCLVPRALDLKRSDISLRKALEVEINVPGRYSVVDYELPIMCSIRDKDLLTTLTKDVFIVGYNWMNEKTMKCIRKANDDKNQSLYEYMRTVVTDRRILSGFVFSALMDDKDFVILDEFAFFTGISRAANDAWKLGRSPADLAVQAMTEVVPLADSVIADTINSGGTLDFDLTAGKYYQNDNSFTESMRAVWGTSVSCFPIMREGRMLVIALFPTEFRSELAPILTVHRASLEEIAKQKIALMKKLLKILLQVRPSSWAETLGQFGGAFAASYIKTLQHH